MTKTASKTVRSFQNDGIKKDPRDVREVTDGELLDAMLRRDNRAWTELMRRFDPLLRIVVRRRLIRSMGTVLASDAVDDVMGAFYLDLVERDMRKLRTWGDGPRRAKLSTWLTMIAGQIAVEHVRQVNVGQHVAIEHEALMRRVAGDQPGEVGGRGPFHRKIGRKLAVERIDALARRPQLAVIALRIVQRRFDSMAAPQPHRAAARPAAAAPALHPACATAQRPFWRVLATSAHVRSIQRRFKFSSSRGRTARSH